MNKTCASTMPLTTLFCATISFLRANIQYLSCVSSCSLDASSAETQSVRFSRVRECNITSEHRGWEEGRRKRKRGEGWDEIHQIWWHGDVDNVFCVQLREGKVEHSHFAPPPSVFNSKWVRCSGFSRLTCPFVPPLPITTIVSVI